MNDATFLSPPKAAKLLGVHPEKIVGWINSGELLAMNVSNRQRPRWRIRLSDLESLIAARSNRRGA